jgi:hypothetical protein
MTKVKFMLSQCQKCGERIEVKAIGERGDHTCPPLIQPLDDNTKPS